MPGFIHLGGNSIRRYANMTLIYIVKRGTNENGFLQSKREQFEIY